MTSLTPRSVASNVVSASEGVRRMSLADLYGGVSKLPLGKQAFSRAVILRAPYFASINPYIADLRPGRCEVHAKKRRSVRNHLGSFHAIAMCNMAELAGGMMTHVSVPAGYRWIPNGMEVAYLTKARTDLRAIAELDPIPVFDGAADLPVEVRLFDTDDREVVNAVITMRVSPIR